MSGDIERGECVYRYWVELRDRRDGSGRDLPLHGVIVIRLPTKKGETRLPDEHVLRLQDHSAVIEAKSIDDLAAQLRQKYPDESYERVLHRERDVDAERRKAEALDGLIELLANAVADEVLCEEQERSVDKSIIQGLQPIPD